MEVGDRVAVGHAGLNRGLRVPEQEVLLERFRAGHLRAVGSVDAAVAVVDNFGVGPHLIAEQEGAFVAPANVLHQLVAHRVLAD